MKRLLNRGELLKVIIFNVERGFCALVHSPSNHSLPIDCGNSIKFSPIKHIADHEAQNLRRFNSRSIAYFVVSHPHNDHISDIKRLIDFYPAMIYGRNYDWNSNKDSKHEFEYENFNIYSEWKSSLSTYTGAHPDWGMEIWKGGLSVSEAKRMQAFSMFVLNADEVPLTTSGTMSY